MKGALLPGFLFSEASKEPSKDDKFQRSFPSICVYCDCADAQMQQEMTKKQYGGRIQEEMLNH